MKRASLEVAKAISRRVIITAYSKEPTFFRNRIIDWAPALQSYRNNSSKAIDMSIDFELFARLLILLI